MSDAIFFAPLRVPLTDERTGLMSREWYLFFQAMFMRVGGTSGPSNDDLQFLTDVEDATDDGLDIRPYLADLERSIASVDEPAPANPDVAELQALSASFSEDPVIARFTAQWDGLTPASGGGTVNFMRADGAWAVPAYPTVPVGANPSANIGLTAINGSAATFLRSDAAPALSQAIAPTWTGIHIFSPAAGIPVTASPASTNLAAIFNGGGVGAGNVESSDSGRVNRYTFGRDNAVTGNWVIAYNGTAFFSMTTTGAVGFNASAPLAKPAITGSRGANAALASLLTSLANYGLITDSTTP